MIYTREKGDPQYTRERQGDPEYTREKREIVKEKSKSVQKGIQEHSKRGFFKPILHP